MFLFLGDFIRNYHVIFSALLQLYSRTSFQSFFLRRCNTIIENAYQVLGARIGKSTFPLRSMIWYNNEECSQKTHPPATV